MRTPEEYFKEYAHKEPEVWYNVMSDLGLYHNGVLLNPPVDDGSSYTESDYFSEMGFSEGDKAGYYERHFNDKIDG